MKIQFKHQKFQEDAANAVCEVFAGQPYLTPSYLIDQGLQTIAKRGQVLGQIGALEKFEFTGFNNQRLVPELTDERILSQIQAVQQRGQITPSLMLEGKYNLTVEMETGVGKTYTYIKTMFELNKRYGWSKFIVVVPSVAIREGVYKTFEMTQDHFAQEYGKKVRFFIYNSKQLTEIDRFASDSAINVMIINAQAFNAKGKDARRISMKLDEFRSRRPIDILAKTNPILIIDEPQSVEGKQTKERLKDFHPLFTLRYSATPREKYNLIYRLDAMEAYNKKLVKKIAVKGITETGTTATNGYLYLQGVNISKDAPTATVEFDVKTASGVHKKVQTLRVGDNLLEKSGGLDEYQNHYTVKQIDGRDNSIELVNGIKLYAGDVTGSVSEEQLRRLQIRETILTHIERERELFRKGIKVLSLFFIDEVAKYRQYDAANQPINGPYAAMFEEEYNDIVTHLQLRMGEEEYERYLSGIKAHDTHAGYFSVDKKGRVVDSKFSDRKERTSDDMDAYDLIMKNKERLLDRREPVRFIFSHSALREGWDNPNVFQICTLKQSSSEVRKRQEVGRGLRLCVNQNGTRMDASVLGGDVQRVNVLTVIASESYDSFAKGLQAEIAEAVADRPRKVTVDLFKGKTVAAADGKTRAIDEDLAISIYYNLKKDGYVKEGTLTQKFHEDLAHEAVSIAEEAADCAEGIIEILKSVNDPNFLKPENARKNNIKLTVDPDKQAMKEFQELWSKINRRSAYVVDFDTDELIRNAVQALNRNLIVSKVFFKVETGSMASIESKEALAAGQAFKKEKGGVRETGISAGSAVTYDLIGRLVEATTLTRRTIVKILQGMDKERFEQFAMNPEEFILKAAEIINDQKGAMVIEHIQYNPLNETYDQSIFTEANLSGQLDVNAVRVEKNLYDYLLYDSDGEKKFAQAMDVSEEVAVYVKLPRGFYITTPVGRYNPDWAIAFREGVVKHIYFVAETKGSMKSQQLRPIERHKIDCAKAHFKAISGDDVMYHVVDSYEHLLDIVTKA